jgi:hypothetical protein
MLEAPMTDEHAGSEPALQRNRGGDGYVDRIEWSWGGTEAQAEAVAAGEPTRAQSADAPGGSKISYCGHRRRSRPLSSLDFFAVPTPASPFDDVDVHRR